jgi:hypothetical protein
LGYNIGLSHGHFFFSFPFQVAMNSHLTTYDLMSNLSHFKIAEYIKSFNMCVKVSTIECHSFTCRHYLFVKVNGSE